MGVVVANVVNSGGSSGGGGGGALGTIAPPRPGEQNLCILKLRDLYNLAVADSLFFQDLQVM